MNNLYLCKTFFLFSNFFLVNKNTFIKSSQYSKLVTIEFIYKYYAHFLNDKIEIELKILCINTKFNFNKSYFFFIFQEFSKTPNYINSLNLLQKNKKKFMLSIFKKASFYSKSIFVEKIKNLIVRNSDLTFLICFHSKNLLRKWINLYMFRFFKSINVCIFCIYIRLGNVKRYCNFSFIFFKLTIIINHLSYNIKKDLINSNIASCFMFKVILSNKYIKKEWFLLSLIIFSNYSFIILLDIFLGKCITCSTFDFNFVKILNKKKILSENTNFLDFFLSIYLNFQEKRIDPKKFKMQNFINATHRIKNKFYFNSIISKFIMALSFKTKKKLIRNFFDFKKKNNFIEKNLLKLFHNIFFQKFKKNFFNKDKITFPNCNIITISKKFYHNTTTNKIISHDIIHFVIMKYFLKRLKYRIQSKSIFLDLFFFNIMWIFNLIYFKKKNLNFLKTIYTIYNVLSNYFLFFVLEEKFIFQKIKNLFDIKLNKQILGYNFVKIYKFLFFFNNFNYNLKFYFLFCIFTYKSYLKFRFLSTLKFLWYFKTFYFKNLKIIKIFEIESYVRSKNIKSIKEILSIKNLIKNLIILNDGTKLLLSYKKYKKLEFNCIDKFKNFFLFSFFSILYFTIKNIIEYKTNNFQLIFYNECKSSNKFKYLELYKMKKNFFDILFDDELTKHKFKNINKSSLSFKTNMLINFLFKKSLIYNKFTLKNLFLQFFIKFIILKFSIHNKNFILFTNFFKLILYCGKTLKTGLFKKIFNYTLYNFKILKSIKNFWCYISNNLKLKNKVSFVRIYSNFFLNFNIKLDSLDFIITIVLKFLIWLNSLNISHKIYCSDPALKKYVKIFINELFSLINILSKFSLFEIFHHKILMIISHTQLKKNDLITKNKNFISYIFSVRYFSFLLSDIIYEKFRLNVLGVFLKFKYLNFSEKKITKSLKKNYKIKLKNNLTKMTFLLYSDIYLKNIVKRKY
jgi:hypothetical protein